MTIINAVTSVGSDVKLIGVTTNITAFPETFYPPTGYQGMAFLELMRPENLIPTNIKLGVDICGIIGLYEGEVTATKLPKILEGITVNLTSEELEGLKSIREYALYGSKLGIVELPDTCTSIGDNAFGNSTVKQINLGNITELGKYAFYYCKSLESVDLSSLTYPIWSYAFQGCSSLTDVKLNDSMTYLSSQAFNSCTSLTSIVLPSKLNTIDSGAFAGSGLTSIDIPDTVTNIGDYAFQNTKITDVVLPSGLKALRRDSFNGCSNLKTVKVTGPLPSVMGVRVFANCTSLETIYVPNDYLEDYKSATNWSEYADYMVGY